MTVTASAILTREALPDPDQADAPLRDRVNAAPPHWANDTIEAWDDQAFRQMQSFATRIYWSDHASVNVHRVIGTQHPDYQGHSWLEFLNSGKRMDQNLPLHTSNRPYYLETVRKTPMMYYVTLDGLHFYVEADGNHRTCIAKFDYDHHGLSTLHGITVTHYHIDREFYRRYQALKALCHERQLPYQIAGQRQALRRDDTAGWKLDHFQPSLVVENAKTREQQLLDRGGAGRLLDELRGKQHRRWWRWWRS